MRWVDIQKMRKWRYYAAHAKKFRTRKKYRRKIREYINQAWHWYAKPIWGWWKWEDIQNGSFRQMGETTAKILKDLLDVSAEPIDYTLGAANKRQQFYRKELRKIKRKLDEAGIPTRTVFFSKYDKQEYLRSGRKGKP